MAHKGGVVVIILTMNQREKTLQCLSSLMADASAGYQILLWDNGSADGTCEAVRNAYPAVLAHHHPTNLGVASGRNAAARLAAETFYPSYFLFLDNDMLVEPGFVDTLQRPFDEVPQVGQTQAKLRFMHDRERLNDGGGARINFMTWRVKPVGFGEVDRGQYDTVRRCTACGGAMMVRAELFMRLNGFDTRFDPFGPEDLDFSLRLQRAGYSALYIPQAVAYHAVSHTYGRNYDEEYARTKLRHWLLFMRRHASLPQKLGFFLGAPFLGAQVMLREGKKGNFRALVGFARGLLELLGHPGP